MPETETNKQTDDKQAEAEPAEAKQADAKQAKAEPAEAPVPKDLNARVEAALVTLDRAITAGKLGEALGGLEAGVTPKAVEAAVDQLNQDYEKTGRTFRIEKLAGGYQVMTLPKYADVLASLHKTRQDSRLSPAQLETLAIVAYKQPILRAEVEAIRGSASGEVLRALMERHLVKIVGRAEEIGRPMLYGTTKQFLEVFGLATLKDLPQVEALNAPGAK